MAAKLRKHSLALVALAVFHFVVFFPVLFMGRVISPNDVFYNYQPWATYTPASLVRVQNSILNDVPTSYLPLVALMKSGPAAFHWNPYIGSGIPGYGSSASALFTPVVLFPALFVPLPWIYTAILLLKLNVAFWFAYAWLREEKLGKSGAAIGAIVIAGAGVYTARWLWQITNATVFYPALLWVTRRTFAGKRTPALAVALIAFSYAVAGFPSAIAYGAYLAIAYALFLMARDRRFPARPLAAAGAATVLALLAAAPMLVPFAQFLHRSGYLELRQAASAAHYPLHHWLSFFQPQRLGNHALKNWTGDRTLPVNNDVEAAIYVGALAGGIALLSIFDRRHRRWFWIVAAAVILLAMFGLAGVPALFAGLPGFKYTAISRIVLLLPVAAGYLTASGATLLLRMLRRRAVISVAALVLAAAVSFDLAVFAGTFHPYLRPDEAAIPATPVIRFLQHDRPPFRFAGMLGYMWPNSAELFQIQDIASHFTSEAAYRRLLQRVDPTSFGSGSTVIQFNSLKFNFTDPIVSMLGVRYILEHREIDIIRWTIFGGTVPVSKQNGAFRVPPNAVVQRTIKVDAEPFWAIEVPAFIEAVEGAEPSVSVELLKSGAVVWSRTFAASDVRAMEKLYIPLRPHARLGESVTVRLRPRGMTLRMPRATAAPAGDAPLFYARVAIPLIFDRELPDGRVFRNLGEVPRFHAVKRLRKLNVDEMLAARDIDFADEAVITDDPVFPPPVIAQDGRAALTSYAPAEQHLLTDASAPMFLASSEKLTPELRITVDGRPARPVGINAVFAGVNVPAGHHQVMFSRRIGRGWWIPAGAAALGIMALAVAELISARRRR